jgi:predicted transcriptional regulator
MHPPEDILISVEHDYAVKMLNGSKTAEIRRRQLRIQPGTRLWVYSKLPRGHIELVAIADEVVAAPPQTLWELYRERIAITRFEFRSYLQGVEVACAILLRDITPLRPALKLQALRRTCRDFHPPQFFKRLVAHGPELKRLASLHAPV